MSSKDAASVATILSLNLLLFVSSLVSAQLEPPSPPTSNRLLCQTEDMEDIKKCANILNTLNPESTFCCRLIEALVELGGSGCICNAIEDNIFGFIDADLNISYDVILSRCRTNNRDDFRCIDTPTSPPPPNPTRLPPTIPPSTPLSIPTTLPPTTPPSIPPCQPE
ncbi:hypothetical protein TSUD_379160 [Trifolium subterraneum]|uniref:Hydrophobic seed protein domain-containing protein n=1 Tax=Trifolium subterraneum TaxID=3900 RepID=A0A2Z6PL53_TRISU|nr:hypothetical protein TSUD_379160 [Trifolium subterraneum]